VELVVDIPDDDGRKAACPVGLDWLDPIAFDAAV